MDSSIAPPFCNPGSSGNGDPVTLVVVRLQSHGCDPRPTGKGYEARCPVHRGSKHNLSIAAGDDGRALVRCHHVDESGRPSCPLEDVVAALDLTTADLFPAGTRNGKAAPADRRGSSKTTRAFPTREAAVDCLARLVGAGGRTTEWEYHDASGAVAMVVMRIDDPKGEKTYRPIRPVDGGWRAEGPPGKAVLFNLPRILGCPGELVYVVEGEKAAKALGHYMPAVTTAAFGAGKASKTDWSPLAGRSVVILPDNDAPGEGHAKGVIAELAKLDPRPTVRVVRLRDILPDRVEEFEKGDDVADWLPEIVGDKTGDDAVAHVRGLIRGVVSTTAPVEPPAPKPEPTSEPEPERNGQHEEHLDRAAVLAAATDEELGIVEADAVEVESPVWLWPTRFLRGKLNLVAGEGGDGKTTVAIAFAAAVTRGGPLPDGTPLERPGRVIFMTAEDGVGDTIIPRFLAAGGDLSRLKILTARVVIPKKGKTPAMVSPVTLQDLEYWREVFARAKPDLLVVDPVPAYIGSVNDHRNSEVQCVLNRFTSLATEFDVCVNVITHTGKARDLKMVHRVLGSVAYTNVCRVVHVVAHDPDDPGRRFLARPKCNLDEPRKPLAYRIESAEIEHQGKTIRTCRAAFESEPVDVDVEALSDPSRKRRGPAPAKTEAVAEWLFDHLDGNPPTLLASIFDAAGAAGHIGPKRPDGKWSGVAILYQALDRVPSLPAPRSGRRIEPMKAATGFGGNKVHWHLVDADSAF